MKRETRKSDCFEDVLQASSDAVVMADESGRILFWNRAAEQLFGYSPEEAGTISITDLMPSEYHGRHAEGFDRFISTGKGRILGKSVTVKGKKRDGTVFPIELSLAAHGSGKAWTFAAIIRDITARRRYELKLAHQSRLLVKANQELAILARVSALLSQSVETGAILSTILDTITGIDLFRFERKGGIFIVKNGALTLEAHLGHNEDFLKKHGMINIGECLCGLAAETGHVITSGDSSVDARHTISYEGMEPHGHVIIPLKAKNCVVGVLYLYMKPDSRVEGARMHFLESIGAILGAAISNSLLYEETKMLALHDYLTGLPNKRLLGIELERNFALSKRYERPLSCLMIDLDHFKNYNDSHGHVAGDILLQSVAMAVTSSLRETDLASRYGGEEFCVLLPETGLEKALLVAEKIRAAVKAGARISASIGVAAFDPVMSGPAELVEAADKALYLAKERGRDRVESSGC